MGKSLEFPIVALVMPTMLENQQVYEIAAEHATPPARGSPKQKKFSIEKSSSSIHKPNAAIEVQDGERLPAICLERRDLKGYELLS